jgi:hypothetical protein
MIDMYGTGPIGETRPTSDRKLSETCPLFDGEGYKLLKPGDWRRQNSPRFSLKGGPFDRIFNKNQVRHNQWQVKTPLILQPGLKYWDPHTVFPLALSLAYPESALLHFKFFASLPTKAANFVAEKQHVKNSEKYQIFVDDLAADPELRLDYSGSRRLHSFEQFIEMGIAR